MRTRCPVSRLATVGLFVRSMIKLGLAEDSIGLFMHKL